jgi:hypothetical protein
LRDIEGAATMQSAAGVQPKVDSENLGHSTVAFTLDVYTEVAEQLSEDAATRIGAFIPRKGRAAQWPRCATAALPGADDLSLRRLCGSVRDDVPADGWAEARGFEPRMAAKPNRISSAAP